MPTHRVRPVPVRSALLLLLALIAATVPVGRAVAQADVPTIEKLRRDQDEILRKAERLQALMERLQQRYAREGKQEQVEYLKEGIAHLERSGILRDVATIREDLETAAFTEALRKQREVVDDLERLLNILLARKSIENIDQQLQQVEQQARTAGELERRQRELIQATDETLRGEASATEQELADRLAQLRDAERREADRNARQAGTRRPFLESALQRIEALLRQQERLEAGLADEAAGRTPEARARAFDLGELTQRVRELQGDLRDQGRQRELGAAGKELQQASAGGDAQALQQARDQLDALLENPPKQLGGPEGRARDPDWAALRERSHAAPETDSQAGREALREIGASAEQLAAERDAAETRANAVRGAELQRGAADLAERMQATAPAEPAGERAVDAVREAAAKLDAARQASERGDADAANQRVNEALTALDRARARHEQENPDAARNAARMAADARAAARELANAPNPDAADRDAGQALDEAAQALRDVEQRVEAAREAGQRPDAGEPAASARQALQSAKDALQGSLANAAENNQEDLQSAAQAQQQLAQAAADVGRRMQEAAQAGKLTPEQRSGAEKRLQEAQQHMQNAGERLQQGQQASAANEQRAAAQSLQQAMDALQENRALTEQQRQQLAEQAKAQEQLTEDIIQLAKELKERDNKAAERAVQAAAEASRRAQRAMDEGDPQETQQQQETARQKLQEAVEELEQEKDRYQDLRQEELLFRMKDELTSFLEKQRPITAETLEHQASAGDRGLSRAARRKVNQLGEEEQALAGKIEFLVNALTDEGNLVYRAVLSANLDDLREVARRLAGRAPDVGAFTTLLQQDVERRSEQLLAALERERQRREQERQQQQQQQDQGQNRFNPQRERLVSLIAELEMLKQLGVDTRRATDDLRTLVEVRGDETVSEAEVAMIQRLAHRHGEITKLFQQIKAGVEEALQQMQGNDQEGGTGR